MRRIRHSKLMKNRDYTVIALALFALAGSPSLSLVQADQLTMLTDFGLPRSASPSQFINVNGLLFFVANMDYGGGELWRSDGTTAGTFRVKKGTPYIGSLVRVNGTLFFINFDDARGSELWKSD